MPHSRTALKFLIGASMLRHRRGRMNWPLTFALLSTAATLALIALYFLQRGT